MCILERPSLKVKSKVNENQFLFNACLNLLNLKRQVCVFVLCYVAQIR